jgi:hypothetical protein
MSIRNTHFGQLGGGVGRPRTVPNLPLLSGFTLRVRFSLTRMKWSILIPVFPLQLQGLHGC